MRFGNRFHFVQLFQKELSWKETKMNNSWFYMTGKFTLRFEPLSCAKMQKRQNELLKTCIFELFKNYFCILNLDWQMRAGSLVGDLWTGVNALEIINYFNKIREFSWNASKKFVEEIFYTWWQMHFSPEMPQNRTYSISVFSRFQIDHVFFLEMPHFFMFVFPKIPHFPISFWN